MKSLGKIIKKKTGAKNLEALTLLMKKAPYSQPIQRLGRELSMDDNTDILLRYDWTVDATGEGSELNDESIRSISTLKYKKAKKKKTDKIKGPIDQKSEKEAKEDIEEDIQKVEIKNEKKEKKESKSSKSKIKAKTKTKKSSTPKEENPKLLTANNIEKVIAKNKDVSTSSNDKSPKKQKTEKLDAYTIWLNSLNKSAVDNIAAAKKLKPKKKKSKKKIEKNMELKEKIDSSIKINDKIASKSLAKLYTKEGHYKKAIKVYKALSLKNPKKSSFFAAEIQKLKDKLS